ncbi:TcfC E-set like domain-containing protein [Aeromonas jandaei]|uniref:TcfC E-set like domain-containing protein n=1 Tax=Aeromonas jandaei TaxID=650 RepID=UPI002AA0D823|nr:TcfC E-set like domain-containing protein [Aeromonas jandaei]
MYKQERVTVLILLATILMVKAVKAVELDAKYANLLQDLAPEEFKALLVPNFMSVEFLFNNAKINVNAKLSNYNVIVDDMESLASLKKFLLDNNVEGGVVDKILISLKKGKESATDCNGNKAICQVQVVGYFSVVTDAASKRVRLFLSSSAFRTESGKVEYYSPYNNNPAFINRLALTVNNFAGTSTQTFNDKVVLGLPYGHVRAEVFGSGGGANVNVLEYALDFPGVRMMAGRSQSFDIQNGTSLLNFSSPIKTGVYLMSSGNLMRGQPGIYQRVYYYTPQSGVIEAYRDDVLLFSRSVEAGQNYISYNQLPLGVYTLTLRLKSGENTITEEVIGIFNNPSVTQMIGQINYTFGIALWENDVQERPITEASMAFRPWDHLRLAVGGLLRDQSQLLSGAAHWTLSNDVSLEGSVGVFSDSVSVWKGSFIWGGAALSYQVLSGTGSDSNLTTAQSSTTSEVTLSSMMFGKNNDGWMASLSSYYQLGDISPYVNVSYSNYRNGAESVSTHVGASSSFFADSRLGVTVRMSENRSAESLGSRKQTDIGVGLNWSMPLGGRTQAMASMDSNNGQATAYSSVRHQFEPTDNLSTALEVGGQYDGTQSANFRTTGSLTYRGKAFDVAGSGSMSENYHNLFFNATGSQIISSQGIQFTAEDSESYLMVSNSSESSNQQEQYARTLGRVSFGSGDYLASAKELIAGEGPLVTSLNKYNYYSVKIQSDDGVLHNRGEQDISGFVFPGSLMVMDSNFVTEYQLLGAFYLPDGNPATELTCKGPVCLQVDKLDDGLFKIRLGGEGSYRLISGRFQCLGMRKLDTENRLTRLARVDCTALPQNEGEALLASAGGY